MIMHFWLLVADGFVPSLPIQLLGNKSTLLLVLKLSRENVPTCPFQCTHVNVAFTEP